MSKHSPKYADQTEQLKADLQHLTDTVEELVNATSEDASSEMRDLRNRAERSLKDTRARLEARGEQIYTGTRDALNDQADSCDRYVRENPWASIGIGTAVGLVVGLMLGRK